MPASEFSAAGRGTGLIGRQGECDARTVQYHLSNVFSKLGITSRSHLRPALPGEAAGS